MFKFLTAFVEVATDLLMGGNYEEALATIARGRNATLPFLSRMDRASMDKPTQFGAEAAALLSQMEVSLPLCWRHSCVCSELNLPSADLSGDCPRLHRALCFGD